MSSPALSKHLLLALCRSSARPVARVSQERGRVLHRHVQGRSLTGTSRRQHSPSPTRRETALAQASSPVLDDQWIPLVPLNGNPSTSTQRHPSADGFDPTLPSPFSPPPPPPPPSTPQPHGLEATSDLDEQTQQDFSADEPQIEIREDLREPIEQARENDTTIFEDPETSKPKKKQRWRDRPDKQREMQASVDSVPLFRNAPIIGSDIAQKQRIRTRPAGMTNAEYAVRNKHREHWQIRKDAILQKLNGESWNPSRKVSPDAMEGIRAMHAQYPEHFTTPVLAKHFQISPEAIRRILKSKWKPTAREEDDRQDRWVKRGAKIWSSVAEKGIRPAMKWRNLGIDTPAAKNRAFREAEQSRARDDEQSRWAENLHERLV